MIKLVRGKRPLVSRDILVETILKHKNELVYNNEIVRATAAIWKMIEVELDNKMKATSLHSMCVGNRYHLKSMLTGVAVLNVEHQQEVSLNDSILSTESNSKSICFILSIKTSKFESLLTERVYARTTKNGKKGERRITIFQPSKWTEIVAKKIYDDYHLNHGFHFKNHYLTRKADYGVFKGFCKCGSIAICKVLPPDQDKAIRKIECSISEGKADCGKRQLRGTIRKKIAKDLQTESTVKWRCSNLHLHLTVEMMDVGISAEPPHLYNADALRVAKHEYIRSQYLDQDPIKAIAILKRSSIGQNVIREIGYDPFYVMITSAHQIRVFNKVNKICETNLCIDATGGVAKKIIHVDGSISKHIFLYNAVAYCENQTISVTSQFSESHDMVSISKWLLGTIRCGMEFPRQVTIDESKALENACALTFSGDFNITHYVNRCFNSGKSDFPKTYIRTDVAHFLKSWVNFCSIECKEKWKKKYYLCAMGQLILCRDRDSATRVITALLTIALSEKAGVGATSLKESVDLIKCLMSSQKEEVDEIINRTTEDSEKDIEESIVDGEDEPLKSNLVANQWHQWGIEIRNKVETKLKCEDGDDFNPRHFPAFADRLIKKIATIPLWSCICRDDFGYGRIPASSAPVESEFNVIKNRILCNRLLRVDVAVKKFLEYSDGKLKIFEAKSRQAHKNVNFDTKSKSEVTKQRTKIDVSSDISLNQFEADKELSSDFPIVSINSTTASEIVQTLNSSSFTDIFNENMSPITSTKTENDYSFECFEEKHISGSKYEIQRRDNSIQERQPLQDLSSKLNQGLTCEYCKKTFNNVNAQVCVICKGEICFNCVVFEKEEEDEIILCLACFQNSRKSDRLATQKIDNWRGQGVTPKISKKSRYLNKNNVDFLDAMSFKRYCKLPILKNGTVSSLRLIKIGNSEVSLTNTCAFDSIFQILLAAVGDNENIKNYFNLHRNENDFFDLVLDTVDHGVRQNTYKRRAEIICGLYGEEIKDNSTHEINCTTSVSSLAAKIFKRHPSFVERRQCQKGCSRQIEFATYGCHARSLKENIQSIIQELATNEKMCRNCETYQTISLKMGDIVLFEIYGQEDQIPIDAITNSFSSITNEIYQLMGIVHYVGSKMLTRTPLPGHYVAYCKRGTCWMVYDDLREKADRSRQNCKVYPELLIYCKI